MAAASVLLLLVSAGALAFYNSRDPMVLQRMLPDYVRWVTDPLVLSSGLGLCAYAARTAINRTSSGWIFLAAGFFGLLNLYFLWTSRVPLFALQAVLPARLIDALQSYGIGFGSMGNLPADLIASTLLIASLLCVYAAYSNEESSTRLLRCLQLGSLCTSILPIDIFLFDRPEFGIHVTSLQQHYDFAVWFTNADLLMLCSFLFGATTSLLILRGGGHFRLKRTADLRS